ncbi:MAG TPA: DegT/DnrJ/EryC1/StrS family aminotransferase [Bryobacteraceae bacterium]|nr:DegT/DnrJ/EryC1/StrS family aminotransferase [Bryobacteraceae bacterium]
MKRRTFVGAMVAATGAATTGTMAAQSGKPVRETVLKGDYWGPQFYGAEEREQLMEVLETGRPFRWYGRGDQPPMKVATFEKEFAARMQTKYALAVTSGTAALEAAIAALRIGPGDEVIIPAWTWHSSASCVIRAGALPVFAEIDESFNLDPNDIERRITPQTKMIMAVHLQGCPADMDRIIPIARKHNIKLLEDCAQSVGGSYKGKPLGSMGDISIFSHQLNKTISAGEGGSVITNDPVLFERAARFHDLGGLRGLHQDIIGKAALEPFAGGANFRMTEFTGGVLLAQLRKLDKIVGSVRANSKRVREGIQDLPGIRFRQVPDPDGDIGTGVFIRFDSKAKRSRFMAAMKAENVPVAAPGGSVVLPVLPYIEKKLTLHAAWPTWTTGRGKTIKYGAASCPKTLDVLDRFAGPLIDPKYTKKDTDDIIAAVRKVYPTIG